MGSRPLPAPGDGVESDAHAVRWRDMAVTMAISNASTRALAKPGVDDAERTREWRQVEAAARGDALAFRAIVERHHHGLHTLALRLLHDPGEAEDAVQEAFARAYCAIDRFDPTYRLSTWLYGITLNVCRDVRKSARVRRMRVASPDIAERATTPEAGPETLVAEQRRAERVWRALDRMRPGYREILVLKDMQELSYQEIREITGAPITALKIRAIRARAQLRTLLGEER